MCVLVTGPSPFLFRSNRLTQLSLPARKVLASRGWKRSECGEIQASVAGLTSGYEARIRSAVKGDKSLMGRERGDARTRQVDGSWRL